MKISLTLSAITAACGVASDKSAFAFVASPLPTPTPTKNLRSFSSSKFSLFLRRFNLNEETGAEGSRKTSESKRSLILCPPEEKLEQDFSHTALVLLPGCLLQPQQYEALARAVQHESKQAIWIVVPKLPLDMANPVTVPSALNESLNALRDAGYSGEKIFLGGHSLGGVFLPDIFEKDFDDERVAGLILLGCFLSRDHRKKLKRGASESFEKTPRLILSGDLDGLVRVSRIAEDFHNQVVKEGNSEKERLHHSVVLVEGMNHFQFVEGKYPIIHQVRDLKPEISDAEAVKAVASTIGQFVDCHSLEGNHAVVTKQRLLAKISSTEQYLKPLLQAMAYEGSYHMDTPCHYCENEDEDELCDVDCNVGSPWAAKIQEQILNTSGLLGFGAERATNVRDEFRESWWINPLADPPFYHPHVNVADDDSVELGTVTEAVYEKSDYFFFDGGLFSNTARELRSKFNSIEAILHAIGDGKESPQISEENICSKMNAMTIKWAFENAPHRVKKRYLDRGTKLKAGKDIEHHSGPSWIWTYLDFTKTGDCSAGFEDHAVGVGEEEECRIIDSHTMKTPLDHPVPAAGGKLYCKLLSPARVLDWMYTDSLRGAKEAS